LRAREATAPSVNPKERNGKQKPALGLIPPVALLHCATAFEDGARKYGAYNWREVGVESMTYVHAALRHLGNYLDGEEFASDSGVHNLGAVMACCAILLDCDSVGNLRDNRPRPGKSSQVQDELKAKKTQKGSP
jgi:hypothetical protein